MATKPLTTPEIWASNALYTTGPFIGSASKVVPPGATAAEGHRPGNLFPTPAEYENSQQNEITTWIVDWLFLGSSAGAADAHIVETNSSGRATLQGLTVNDAINELAVSITGVGTVTPALYVQNTSGGSAIEATTGNSNAVAVFATIGTGDGDGVYVDVNGTGASGSGITIDLSAATAAPGLDVIAAGTGPGINVTVTGNDRGIQVAGGTGDIAIVAVGGVGQSAIFGVSGTNGDAGVGALGVGTALGVDATGGSGSSAATGVRGTALHEDAMGVHGRTATVATAQSAGVLGEGRDRGIGVWGRNTTGDGFGVVAHSDTTNPEFAALQLIQQNNDPVNAYGGDVCSHSTMNQLRHGASTGVFHGVYQSPADVSGCSANILSVATNAVYANNSPVIWTDTLQPSLTDDGNGYYGTGPGAELTFTIVMDCRLVVATPTHIEVQVIDLTNGNAVIFSRATAGGTLTDGYYLPTATTEWQRSLAIMFQYSPPSEGALDFNIQIRGAGVNVEVRDVGCTIIGTIVP